jgi:c-di-AMP phosphodiesterase-like protein
MHFCREEKITKASFHQRKYLLKIEYNLICIKEVYSIERVETIRKATEQHFSFLSRIKKKEERSRVHLILSLYYAQRHKNFTRPQKTIGER